MSEKEPVQEWAKKLLLDEIKKIEKFLEELEEE